MELELWVIALLCLVFFLTAIMDAISGGGGLVTVPAMLLAGVPPEITLGTVKMVAHCGICASFGNYARSGLILWKTALTGVPAIALGAALGAHLVLALDSELVGKVIVFLLPVGVLAVFMPRKDKGERAMRPGDLSIRLPLIGLLIGAYDGFFGPGSGTFLIIALHVFLGMGLIPAVANSKMIGLAGGIGGLVVFILRGAVDFYLALPLAVCCIAGNLVGSRLAMKVGTALVRRFLVLSLALLFGSLIWKFWIG